MRRTMKISPHSSLPRIPFTQLAYEKMVSDVQRLQKEREETLERLKIAREQGDLSENGAYRYAKMELGNISRQLRTLHHLIKFADVKKIQSNHEFVEFGSTVTLTQNDKEYEYMLVSEYEADPLFKKLSMVSPIGTAVMGKHVGDSIAVTTPSGIKKYVIKKIA